MNLTLEDALGAIKEISHSGLEKTAAENEKPPTEKTSGAQQELIGAINKVLESDKTAAAPAESGTNADAVQTLTKMASDLAHAEESAIVKEAHLYGAAVADGFMARLQQYDTALGNDNTDNAKTANEEPVAVPTQDEFTKFAEVNPALVNQAMERGYADGQTEVDQIKQAAAQKAEWEKFASTPEGTAQLQVLDAYVQRKGVREKIASAKPSLEEQQAVSAELEKLAQTPEGQVKLADIRQGYADTMGETVKIANGVFNRGYRDVVNLVERNIAK